MDSASLKNVGRGKYGSNISSSESWAKMLTAGHILKAAAELDMAPSVVLDVIGRVIEQRTSADVKRVGDLEDCRDRRIALST